MGKKNRGSILRHCKSPKRGLSLIVILLVLLIFITASLGYLLFKSSRHAEPTLRFLSIIHRHGERAPSNSYALGPYKNESLFWPEGFKQLLPKGKVNMFELGKQLRNRYDGFVSSKYKPAELLVTTNCNARVMMSAELLLAGLYPPVENQIWNADLLWQPIPVHSLPDSYDDMLRLSKPCALLSKEKKYVDTNFLQQILNENQEFVSFLSKNTGVEIKSMATINIIYSNLRILEMEGFQLPEWTQDVYPDKLKSLAKMEFLAQFETPTMIKLHSGVLINKILSDMIKKKSTKEFERRLSLYTGSDRAIVRLWRGMNITQELTDNPSFGATFIVELHEIKDKHRVKILYKNHALEEHLRVLTVRGCENDQIVHQDGMCDLDTFSSALQAAIITDFDKECTIPH